MLAAGTLAALAMSLVACEESETSDEDTVADDDDGDSGERKKKKKKKKRSKSKSTPSVDVRINQIAHGRRHGCAVLANGVVKCWGRNGSQQLGMPVPEFRLKPGPVSGIADATQIAASRGYTCAINSQKSVLCWGRVPERGTSPPAAVPGLEGAVSIAAAPYHLCAALVSGEVKCLGSNRKGELGNGTTTGSSSVPTAAVGVAQAVEVAVGYQHTCARDAAGKVMCWGRNGAGQLGDGTKVDRGTPKAVPLPEPAKMIAAGDRNSCAVVLSGAVHCWGEDGYKFLEGKEDGTKPHLMTLGAKASAVAVGDNFACALLDDGGVSCWGRATGGRLARNSGSWGQLPDRVPRITGATSVAAEEGIACAVTDGGKKAYCWGEAEYGRLGDGSSSEFPTPVPVPKLSDATEIVAGDGYTCARRSAGNVACWGDGSLDTGTMEAGFLARANVPTDVAGTADIKALLGLSSFVLATKNDDSVVAFHGGLLRDPGSYWKKQFAVHDMPALKGIADATVVYSALSYGVLSSGRMLAFKMKVDGNLDKLVLSGVAGASTVNASMKEVCFVRTNGTVGCFEQTLKGYGAWPASYTAKVTDISGVSDAIDVDIDYGYGCILHKAGEVSCWRQSYGSKAKTPVKITGVTGATKIVTSSDISTVSCALLTSGAVKCWSDYGSHEGQLGTGTFSKRQTPASVTGIMDAVDLVASDDHVCALHKTGKVSCWGDNAHDQVGAAAPPFAWAPVEVRIK
jgi:alpha-tubulin suppressor-like RCC1 family protein